MNISNAFAQKIFDFYGATGYGYGIILEAHPVISAPTWDSVPPSADPSSNQRMHFAYIGDRQIQNDQAFAWPAAITDWGLVTHIVFALINSGESCHFWAELETPIQINTGDILIIPANTITIQLD